MCTCPNYMVWNGKYTHEEKVKFDFQPHAKYESILKMNVPFIEVPCGKCLECRIQYARAWADRCVLEAKQYKDNYFVTLTYDDAHCPKDGSLRPRDLQLFMKRLRKHFSGTTIRFFASGEYGETLRPHYHLILFNCPLNDLSYCFQLEQNGRLQNHIKVGSNNGLQFSLTIYDLWQRQGMISVAPFSYDTAAYVSQYVTKKVGGIYEKKLKGLGLAPEFLRESRNPGIGAGLYDDDLYQSDHLIVPSSGNAHVAAIPRYFDKLFIKKYGDDVFTSHVRHKRLKKKFRNLTNYVHDTRFKDKDNELRDYRLKKKQIIRNEI